MRRTDSDFMCSLDRAHFRYRLEKYLYDQGFNSFSAEIQPKWMYNRDFDLPNDPAYVLKPTDFIKFLAKGWKPLKRTDEK